MKRCEDCIRQTFTFVYNPGLLVQGSLGVIAMAVTTALIGACLVAAAMRGYLLSPLNFVQRVLAFVAGCLWIARGLGFATAGLALAILTLIPDILGMLRQNRKPA